ncbi:MAG: DEAD/DEAH box helicase [Faecalibacterium sp.]
MNNERLKALLGVTIFNRAMRDYEHGRVREYEESESAPNTTYLWAKVMDTVEYEVSVWLNKEGDFISASCDCPAYRQVQEQGAEKPCKHIGAVILQYIAHNSLLTPPSLQEMLAKQMVQTASALPAEGTAKPPSKTAYSSSLDSLFGKSWRDPVPESDQSALALLRRYSNAAVQDELRVAPFAQTMQGRVSLVLEFILDPFKRGASPEVRVRIGAGGHYYIVKSIPDLIEAVETEREVSYGKQLAFVHHKEAFDLPSQQLLGLLTKQVSLVKYAGSMVQNYSRATLSTGRQGSLVLAAPICDALYDFYLAEGLLGDYTLAEGEPAFVLEAEKRKGGLVLSIYPRINWFRGEVWVYFFDDTTIWRVSPSEFDRIAPALETLGGKPVFFTAQDAAAFCSYVLPEIRKRMKIQDPDRLLLNQIPLIPVVQYYLDAPHYRAITAYPVFMYGEDKVSPIEPIKAGFLRDKRTESRTKALLANYMKPALSPQNSCLYEVTDEEDLYHFLEEGVPSLLATGEVYMSDAFRGLQAPPPKISVGISVAGSVLDLNIDSGEFPPEELRALLNTLHQKKRYHRLRDGRLLKIDRSMDVLDELEETLALSGAELVEGNISLPMYRAPSLDKALAGQEGIHFSRDDAFRRISRSFHNVADSEYVLPISLQKVLRKYQRTGYRWLRTLDAYGMGGILADDMGLGKTLQVLAYLLSIKEKNEPITAIEADDIPTRPAVQSIIVCPASLVLNWAEECQKFTPELKYLAVDGNAAERLALAATFGEYDLIITSYDLLRRDIDLYKKHDFYACIIDEAQAIKNHTTQKYKAVCKIKSKLRFALTGTPIENRLSELWSIFSFLMPGYLYQYSIFRETFERPIAQEQDATMVHRLNQVTSPFILRRMKTEVLKELPPKMEHVQHVVFDEEQKKLYHAAVMDARQRLRALKPEDRIQVFAVLTNLRQLCCDPRLALDGWAGDSAKLEACAELISAAVDGGHRILLFSQFTSMLSLIANKLDEMGVSHFTLQGSTPKPMRAELVHRFNDGEVSVFLISLKAGGTGLNLTAADIVIHYDPWWNVAAQNQATDRAYRIGQHNAVQVYKLIVQDTIEEKIMEMQQAKQDLANTITGSSEGSIMSMKPEELLALLEE